MAVREATADHLQPAVSAEGVYVSLGGMPVLRDVGIRVRPGEAVSLAAGDPMAGRATGRCEQRRPCASWRARP